MNECGQLYPMQPFPHKIVSSIRGNVWVHLGLHVYTVKDSSCVSSVSRPLDPECTKTTKIVLGLLEKAKLFDK